MGDAERGDAETGNLFRAAKDFRRKRLKAKLRTRTESRVRVLRRIRHSTRCERIIVHYPFHPFVGLNLEVVFDGAGAVGPALTVRGPDGDRRKIPRWMTEAVAAQLHVEPPAVISLGALLAMAELLHASAASSNELRGGNVSSTDRESKKGGGGEATQLEDRASPSRARQPASARSVVRIDGKRRGGSAQRRR